MRAAGRLRGDLLAADEELDRGRGLAGGTRTAPGPAACGRGAGAEPVRCRRLARARPQNKRGDHIGPNLVDRARPGSEYHLIVDANGIPLQVSLTGGNRNDLTQLLCLVDSIPPVRGLRGRPRCKPRELLADRDYDHDKYRRMLRTRSITTSCISPIRDAVGITAAIYSLVFLAGLML